MASHLNDLNDLNYFGNLAGGTWPDYQGHLHDLNDLNGLNE